MRLDAHFCLQQGRFSLEAAIQLEMQGVVALFGPSGSGKSTFLRCLAGLERTSSGHCRLGETLWQESSTGCFLPPHARSVAVVFQDGRLFSHQKVADNLLYGWHRTPAERRIIGQAEVVELLRLAPLLERWPHHLSGGERQRVALGRALLSSPDLLLLDEPLVSLDQPEKHRILEDLRQLQRHHALPMLYVSHDLDDIIPLARQLAWMNEGRIQALGPLAEMLTRLDLPLAHAPDAAAVIDAVVSGWDARFHLAHFSFGPGLHLAMPAAQPPLGEAVRIRVQARDVSLVLDPPGRTSILNLFPARVLEVVEENAAQVMVKVVVGETPLLARVTQKSRHLLDLHSGLPLFVQIKGVALLQ
ncbi:MAG: molybdenum ABC transporter ATP-binding protein [Magnetococcales bacterium]|nr:molybdenum ABC transporter ATP-binding protein [Magnetococcales bacterium]